MVEIVTVSGPDLLGNTLDSLGQRNRMSGLDFRRHFNALLVWHSSPWR